MQYEREEVTVTVDNDEFTDFIKVYVEVTYDQGEYHDIEVLEIDGKCPTEFDYKYVEMIKEKAKEEI